jgi:beta-lactamase regulating signal transducer with metallopeptidase domain
MTDVIAGAPLAHALGLALLHFVWQGALLGVLTALALVALTGRSPSVRYLVACAGLVAMLGAPVGTWLAYSSAAGPASDTVRVDAALQPSTSGAIVIRHVAGGPATPLPWLASIEPLAPGAVAIWSLGVVILTLRLLGGCLHVEALKRRSTAPLPADWRRRVAELASALGVTRTLNGVESSLVEVPTVVGWLRPLILVPTSALAGLTPSQLEAILAHEIAHIRRHDYLVNVIQHVIETLLFYHPAVWWLSRRVSCRLCDRADVSRGAASVRSLLRGRGRRRSSALARPSSPRAAADERRPLLGLDRHRGRAAGRDSAGNERRHHGSGHRRPTRLAPRRRAALSVPHDGQRPCGPG